jgi:hypothetical protein
MEKRPKARFWKNDKELRKWLLKMVPGLKEAWEARNSLEMAHIMVRWVAAHATFSHRDLLLKHDAGPRELLPGLLNYEGGVWCGGTAKLFCELMQLFSGIYTATWGYGLHKENISHVTTLVGQKDGPCYVFDAYLGYSYRDPNTLQMIPFGDLLHLIRTKQYDRIEQAGFDIRRPAVALPGDRGAGFNWLFDGRVPDPIVYEDRLVFRHARPSADRLFAPGTHNRNRIDRVRGDQPFREFMLDLILKEPQISRWAKDPADKLPYTEFAVMRELVYRLCEG